MKVNVNAGEVVTGQAKETDRLLTSMAEHYLIGDRAVLKEKLSFTAAQNNLPFNDNIVSR
jgi:hypothetical protein